MINWRNVWVVLMATIVVGTECLVVAVAAGWAVSSLMGLNSTFTLIIEAFFVISALLLTVGFARKAASVEPFRGS